MNKQIDSQVIIDIIKTRTTLTKSINQHRIAEEYMWRTNEHITVRTVRRVIEELIEQGEPILSTPHFPNGGYCWGNREEETMECVNRLRKKAAKIFIRARRIKKNCLFWQAKNKNREQLNIFA